MPPTILSRVNEKILCQPLHMILLGPVYFPENILQAHLNAFLEDCNFK